MKLKIVLLNFWALIKIFVSLHSMCIVLSRLLSPHSENYQRKPSKKLLFITFIKISFLMLFFTCNGPFSFRKISIFWGVNLPPPHINASLSLDVTIGKRPMLFAVKFSSFSSMSSELAETLSFEVMQSFEIRSSYSLKFVVCFINIFLNKLIFYFDLSFNNLFWRISSALGRNSGFFDKSCIVKSFSSFE